MLNLDLEEFAVAFKDGAVKHVGPSNSAASAKLFDVRTVEAREFGDRRIKCVFEDESENEVEVALGPEAARELATDLQSLESESRVFEDG